MTRAPQQHVRGDADRRIDTELSKQSIETTAGGGMVRLRMDGHRALRSLTISPEAFDARDADLLADMIMAAFAEAHRRLDDVG